MGKQKKQKGQQKKTKKIKTNRKDMFSELKTFEENKLNRGTHHRQNRNHIQQKMEPEDDSLSYRIPEISLQDEMDEEKLKKYKNIEQQWELVHHLIAKNKINQKNAFNFDLISLSDLPQYTSTQPNDNAWKKMSSTLQNEYKIYSYKIDAIHSITYKILNTMNRNQQDSEQVFNMKKQNSQSQADRLFNFEGSQRSQAARTQLQKNINNINIQGVQYACSFNPKFERTKRKFNQSGFNGLLLNNIEIDANLQLSLSGRRNLSDPKPKQNPINVKVDQMREPLIIPRQLQKIRKGSYRLMRQEYPPILNVEQIWKNISFGNWEEIYLPQNNNMEENQNYEIDQQVEYSMKKIEDVVRMNKRKKNNKKFDDISELVKDGNNWMSQYDKKILGFGGAPTVKKNTVVKNEQDILFDAQFIEKDEVFTQETIEREKNQFFEEIQEKHLLPIRMFYKFKVQQIMTLRKEPDQILLQNNYVENEEFLNVQQYQQRNQIDIKRQQMSIRQTKDKLRNLLEKKTNFNYLYNNFDKPDNQISPSLCFLTILHLANENNLHLQQENDFNFVINK